MKKILILTAAFGDGHNTAARNIRDALEHICDDGVITGSVLEGEGQGEGKKTAVPRQQNVFALACDGQTWFQPTHGVYSN